MADIDSVGFGKFKVTSIRALKPVPLPDREVIGFFFADFFE